MGLPYCRLARLLPTVGCEADAATVHTVDEKTVDGRESSGPMAFLPDGSYSLSWPDAPAEGGLKWQVEHGLVDNTGLRIRVTLTLERSSKSEQPVLTSVKVARERWDSAFQKGESLSSCGGKMRGFADDPRLVKTTIEGAWTSEQHIFTPVSGRFDVVNETVEMDRQLKESNVNVLLPAGVWVKVGEAEGGAFAVSASWMQGEETSTSATRVYGHDGALQVRLSLLQLYSVLVAFSSVDSRRFCLHKPASSLSALLNGSAQVITTSNG